MSRRIRDPLLGGLAAGREEAYAAVYDRYARRLLRTAVAMLHNQADAEDVVQEVFMSIVRSRQHLAKVENLAAYLFASLRRQVARHAAKQRREPKTTDRLDHTPESGASHPPAEQSHRLEHALLSLPAEQREVITLKIDAELTFAEIGQVLGINANTAASRYRYALQKLRATQEA